MKTKTLSSNINQQIIPIIEQLQQEKSQDWRENTMELTQIQFRLDSEIEGPEYYRELLSRIESLTDNDAIELVIDSIGGDLDGCIAICDAIMATPASVTGILVNRAYSAGAFIALCCDNLEVRPYARMMLHTYRGSFGGKDNEVDSDYNFNKAYIRKFISDCSHGFLTDEELDQMFAGRDYWFDGSEIISRLKQRQAILEQESDECEEGGCEDCQNCIDDENHQIDLQIINPAPEYNPDDVSFKLPRQAGNALDDIKAATTADVRRRGYVEEASLEEINKQEKYNFVIASELYELNGEVSIYDNYYADFQSVQSELVRLAGKFPEEDWKIYKLVEVPSEKALDLN